MNDQQRRSQVRGRIAGVIAAAALGVAVFPAGASATDYCVAPNAGCGANNVASLPQALDQADNASDADRIFLGAATYTAPTTGGFSYSASSSPVEIIGGGTDQTVLTAPDSSTHVLSLFGGAGTSVRELTVRVPQVVAGGMSALWTSAAAQRIALDEYSSPLNYYTGVQLQDGGSLEDSNIATATDTNSTAVAISTGGGTVRRTTVVGTNGINTGAGGTIDRVRVTAGHTGVLAYKGVTKVTSSLIRVTGDDAVGISVSNQPSFDDTVNLDGVTVIGPALPYTSGISAGTALGQSNNSTVNMTNSIVRGFSTALNVGTFGSGVGKISASYSDYDPSGNETFGPSSVIDVSNVSNVGDAKFADPANGNYRLLPSSPLVDAGDPSTGQGLDLDGNPLVTDGNGDASTRRDMGAFESPAQPVPVAPAPVTPAPDSAPLTPVADTQAPRITAFKADTAVFALGSRSTAIAAKLAHGTRFRYTLNESAAVKITIRRALAGRMSGGKCVSPAKQLARAKSCIRYSTVGALSRKAVAGANTTAFSGKLGKHALKAGTYQAVIVASDAAGNRSAKRATRFRIVAG